MCHLLQTVAEYCHPPTPGYTGAGGRNMKFNKWSTRHDRLGRQSGRIRSANQLDRPVVS